MTCGVGRGLGRHSLLAFTAGPPESACDLGAWGTVEQDSLCSLGNLVLGAGEGH